MRALSVSASYGSISDWLYCCVGGDDGDNGGEQREVTGEDLAVVLGVTALSWVSVGVLLSVLLIMFCASETTQYKLYHGLQNLYDKLKEISGRQEWEKNKD